MDALQPEVVVAGWGTPAVADRRPPVNGGSVRYPPYRAGSVRGRVTREQIEAGLVVTNWGSAVSRTIAAFAEDMPADRFAEVGVRQATSLTELFPDSVVVVGAEVVTPHP